MAERKKRLALKKSGLSKKSAGNRSNETGDLVEPISMKSDNMLGPPLRRPANVPQTTKAGMAKEFSRGFVPLLNEDEL